MERIPLTPPTIEPLGSLPNRPVWSVMIPTYNCTELLVFAIKSVLLQNMSEELMQIEVVDDASTDANVEKVVQEIGRGRVHYYRQSQNVGSLRNFETCINRAKGHYIHLLHGDDRVRAGYYTTMMGLFERYPNAGAAFCRYQYINRDNEVFMHPIDLEMPESGLLDDWLLRIGERQRIQYVTISVRREVYEKLGSFYGLTYGEDWEMWVRIAKHYPVAYTPEILAEYRKHEDSISGIKIMTGEYMDDAKIVFQNIQKHIPEEHRARIFKKSQKEFAHYGIRLANRLWKETGNKKYVILNIRKAFEMHFDAKLCFNSAKLLAKMLFNLS
jgi:glycosyltransferase involved in cell wall biosynthesis